MAKCSHPHYTIDLGLKENGKRYLKFIGFNPDLSSLKQLTARYGKASIVPLPCGKCYQCKINHAKEWAVRCVLESLEHDNNYFLTLTFDPEHLPKDGKLHREDIQKFFGDLRYRIGSFRYFGCGEYGSKTKRPHYHLILFGSNFDDLKPNRFGKLKSKVLDQVWPYGEYDIGEVTYASCNYVAQYSTKKVFNDGSSDEFLMSSNRPGIGASWCEKNLKKIFDYDAVYGPFGSNKQALLPRYFDKLAERLDTDSYAIMKAQRLDKGNAFELNEMLIHEFDEIEKLLEYKEKITIDEFFKKKRGLRGL